MRPSELAQRLASLQQWLGREIASRQMLLHPDRPWPMPRLIADATVVIDPGNDKIYPSVNPNHVEHFGTSGLANKRIFSEIVEMYRSAGVPRFFVYLSPSEQAEEIANWLDEAGMVRLVELSVLWQPTQAIGVPNCDMEIVDCVPEQADLLRSIVSEGGDEFGYAPATLDMLGTPHFYTLLALDRGCPAGTGSLYHHQRLGYLGNGKTIEPFRRRGAQSALIAARVNRACMLGCTDVVSETYRFLETSLKNLRRAGFIELYQRKIYQWEEGNTATYRQGR